MAATPALSVGREHTLALQADGTVLAWGSDRDGQLGQGRRPFELRPGLVPRITGIKAVAAGFHHSLALHQDGSLWAWGANFGGELGDGSTASKSQPVRVSGLTRVRSMCGGWGYSAALDEDGAVWVWGWRRVLGTGADDDALVPARVPGIEGLQALACGARHVLALRQDGRVLAWGENPEGEVGDGTRLDRPTPTLVVGLSGVKAIAAGFSVSAALKQDGTVWEWGVAGPFDPATSLGTSRPLPSATPGLTGITAIVAGENVNNLVALQAGTQSWWRWQAGTAPVRQASVGPLASASAGRGLTLLRGTDGQVLAYGFNGNNFGSLGDGTLTYRDVPAPVVDLPPITDVVAGEWHGVALDAAGRVWTWGLDASGQLGLGRVMGQSVPAVVTGLPKMAQVSAGGAHNLGLDEAGAVWAWGDNDSGQVGDGSFDFRVAPVKLSGLPPITRVVAGPNQSLALQADGSVWFWGAALPGVQPEQPAIPTRVLGDAQGLAVGDNHVLVLRRDGTVWAWGLNQFGELGDGTLRPTRQPQLVPGLTGIVQVVASDGSSYALGADGRVWAWGANWVGQLGVGQLGDGSVTQRLVPTPVVGLTDVVEIAAGTVHGLARRRDASVWGWGGVGEGALGDLRADTPAPVRLNMPANIQQVSARSFVTALLTRDGLVYSAGLNSVGELGDGSFARNANFALAVNPSIDGLLDLIPTVTNNPVPSALPPFLLRTERRGDLSALTLRANVFGELGPAGARAARNTGRFNVYVLALVGSGVAVQWVALDSRRSWGPAALPLSAFLSNVSLTSRTDSVVVDIFDSVDVSALIGARIFVGYGTDANEMVSARRFREVMTIAAPSTSPTPSTQ